MNNPSYPSVKTSVAEVFSISILTAATLLMMEQVTWHGRPIEAGLYHAQLIKGGYMSAYFLSKYIKCVLFNFLLCAVWTAIKLMFRLRVSGANMLIILWCLLNPLFVFTLSNIFTMFYRQRHQFT